MYIWTCNNCSYAVIFVERLPVYFFIAAQIVAYPAHWNNSDWATWTKWTTIQKYSQ